MAIHVLITWKVWIKSSMNCSLWMRLSMRNWLLSSGSFLRLFLLLGFNSILLLFILFSSCFLPRLMLNIYYLDFTTYCFLMSALIKFQGTVLQKVPQSRKSKKLWISKIPKNSYNCLKSTFYFYQTHKHVGDEWKIGFIRVIVRHPSA